MSHAHELLALMRRPCPAHPTADAKCVLGDGTPACVDCARAEAAADAALPADDPRHGTYAGAVAHWHLGQRACAPCARAGTKRRNINELRVLEGRPGMVPSTGMVRRVRALQAIGYSYPHLARETGVPAGTLNNPTFRGQFVYRSTHDRVREAYDRLCMTPVTGGYSERSRRLAARSGWAPPLAWDDDTIDDPAAEASGIYRAPVTAAERDADDRAKREADLEHAVAHGHTFHRVRVDLGVGPDTVNAWCRRNGRQDLYDALAANTPRETAGAA